MKQPVVLRIYLNGKLEGVKQFTDPQIVFGRNSEAQVDLQDEDVSLLHAAVVESNGTYILSDMGTQSGTFLNGEKVLEAELKSEDEIQIGPYVVHFFIGVPKPGVAPKTSLAAPPIANDESKVRATEDPKVTEEPELRHKQEETSSWEPPPVGQDETQPLSKAEAETDVTLDADGTLPGIEMDSELTTPGNLEVSELTDPGVVSSKQTERRSSPIPVVSGKIPAPDVPNKRTFAPPSEKSAADILKPSKGTVVEVVVAWQERILSTHHFNDKRVVTIGSAAQADIVVPVMAGVSSYPLVEIGAMASVNVPPNTGGELIDQTKKVSFADLSKGNRFKSNQVGHQLDLAQGEMAKIGFQGNLVNVYVRYVPETQKPLVAPFLDLSASEVTGVILAGVVSAIFGVYMFLYSPSQLTDEQRLEEPIRKATVTFRPPKRRVKQVIKAEQKPEKKPKKVVKVVEKRKRTKTPSLDKKGKVGKAGEVAPKKTKSKKKKITSARSGGAIKTGKKKGANMKSRKPDPSKVGLLSVFGSKGAQKKLDKAFSGSGELMGMADQATGYAGDNENRVGDTLGSKIKSTGAGGRGEQTVGISGVGTKGRGTGYGGDGVGGIGTKGQVEINVGGQEAEIPGTMDREAIRRVILRNKRAIRACYERELQRNPNMYGKLVLQWNIEEKGRVTGARVKSNTLSSKKVASCIIKRLKQWIFPEPPPGTVGVVSYPFVFTSQ